MLYATSALLLQVTRADVVRMLRADALPLVLGLLLLAVALASVAAYAAFLRKEAALAWFGLFALAYGVRLLAETNVVRLVVEAPPRFWDYVISTITYTIGLPAILCLRAMFPSWARFQGWMLVFLGAFAAAGIAADVFLGRPHAAQTANNLIAIVLLSVALGLLFRPGLSSSFELTVLRFGLVSFFLTALVDNMRGLGLSGLPAQDIEPIGFAVLIASLGVVVARRVIDDTERLVSIDRELRIARRIQESLLPLDAPRLAGVSIVARYRPMTAVAGDFYDFVEVDDRRVGVLVADVSGHGVPAALIASMVKVAFAAQRQEARSPAAVLAGMNDALFGQLGGQYVTAAYLFLDREAGLVRYGAAGHPPLVRWSAGRHLSEELMENGLPLGLMEGVGYTEVERPTEPGDRFVLYTDGLVEAANGAGEFFGLERVKDELLAGRELSSEGLANRLLGQWAAWSGPLAGDDLTLVVVDCA